MTGRTFGGISTESSDVSVTIEVDGPDKDTVENVARHVRDQAVRAMQAYVEGKHPELVDGCPVSVNWNKVDAVDEVLGPFPNGVYLIADTPRTAMPLAVEDGSGDRDLLRETLSEIGAVEDAVGDVHVVTADRADVKTVTDTEGLAVADRDNYGGHVTTKRFEAPKAGTFDDVVEADGGQYVDESDEPDDDSDDVSDRKADLHDAVAALEDGRVKSAQYADDRDRGRFLIDDGDPDEDAVADTLNDHDFEVVDVIPATKVTQVDVEGKEETHD